MRGVRRQVHDRGARADHRGLVADDVDTVEQRAQRLCVPYVDPVRVLGAGSGRVRLGDEQVDPDHLVALCLQPRGDGAADEPGGPGEQDPHGRT